MSFEGFIYLVLAVAIVLVAVGTVWFLINLNDRLAAIEEHISKKANPCIRPHALRAAEIASLGNAQGRPE
jgi:hypothetical protein